MSIDSSFDLKRIADLLFEVGMLKKTPRSGFQFLGTGQENVAEHSFRAAVVGYVLARLAEADVGKTVIMCLFHDLHEARIGDFNYVNKLYNTADVQASLHDTLKGTGLMEVLDISNQTEARESLEAQLAQDADQIDMMLSLKQEEDLGNSYATKWLDTAAQRLVTDQGKMLAQVIRSTDHTAWWFNDPEDSWWVKGKKD